MSQNRAKEEFSDALNDFNKQDTPTTSIPDVLEEYLIYVAKTGETTFPWPRINKVFKTKLERAIDEFSSDTEFNMDAVPPSPNVENVTFAAIKQRIMDQIDSFIGAPFTIQRLCEMITNPLSHYKRVDKFLRAIEKNVNVVTTVDPFGKKIVCDSKPLINGTESETPNLPPTYSAAPWAPAAPAQSLWSPHAPLLHKTNGLHRTIEKREHTISQSEASESDQSESDASHVTESSNDVSSSLSNESVESAPASDSEQVAMVTESSSVEASSPVQTPPSVEQQPCRTMDSTESVPQLEASRPGKREGTDEEDGLVSPAKRMCLEKDGTVTAEVKEAEAVESNGANHDAKTDDVTTTADVTNGDHVEEKEAEESKEAEKVENNEVAASEDSNDSEALTTSSEDSAEQPAAAEEAPKNDDVTPPDDVSKDGGVEDDGSNQ